VALNLVSAHPPPAPIPIPADPFIYQTPSYVACVDGIGAFGADTGSGFRPADGSTPKRYLITSNSSASTGSLVDTNVYECTLPFAAAHNVSSKIILDLTSGVKDYVGTEINLLGDNIAMIGNTVRADYGGYIKNSHPLYVRGNHVFISGFRFFQSTGTGPIGALRDNVTMGWTPNTGYHVLLGCEFHGGIDESLSFYDSMIAASALECAICSPLEGTAISESASHNYAIIAGHNLNRFSMLRCAIFHAAGRVPLSYARYTAIANCLIYNISDSHFNSSQCIQIDKHPSDAQPTEAHFAAIINSVIANGPDGYANNWPITAANQVSGTQIYASGMSQKGFAQVSTPETFFGTQSGHDARQYRVTTLPASTIPGAWGSSHEYIDSFADSQAGRLALSAALRKVCGVQPKTSGITTLRDHFTQYENYENGTGSGYGTIAHSQNYPTATTFTIDPNNSSHVSSYWGNNAMPSVGDFNTLTADGITQGEVWFRAIRRVHYGN